VSANKIFAASAITFAFVVLTGLIFGLSQMGDCYPEPSVLRTCLDTKGRAADTILLASASLYAGSIWFIFRRRKAK